ncbi:arginine kinase-like [Anoplophora glabripennis]|uniref:arginine kinase-like n=1 Tax=Anoplophora glabripennis TaxID=217634 RepID=UPI0008756C61|nr:arginine kinase-like [Anoplophora glabripennis]
MAKAKCYKCEEKCGKGKISLEELQKLEMAYKAFLRTDSKSLVKKYLTRDVFDRLKYKRTTFGSTLLDCVQSGFENPDSNIGIYAADPSAYVVFADIFNPIIQDYHIGFKKSDHHPATDWGSLDKIGNLDPKGQYVVSTRVRCGRSIEGYPFNPSLTESQYWDIENKMISVLNGLEGELKGTYYPLNGMTKETQEKLIEDHFLFKEGDRFLQAANACRYWPVGRGIYHNQTKTFLVWVNEEDHIRIISLQPGGDLGAVYKRFVSGVADIEKKVKVIKSDRLGYLNFCPTNLGTAIRASVHIKIPKLASNMTRLNEIADRYHLQVRGTAGEHTEAKGGVYDISNKRRLGLTEAEAIQEMYNGIVEIIKLEKSS